MAAAGFQLGRSLFDGILPGTPQQFTRDSHFGRIRSVENQKCLETQFGLNYPVTSECLEIDPHHPQGQSWHYSPDQLIKFFDPEQNVAIDDFFMCLYAFGDKEDNTGYVRVKHCPGSNEFINPDDFDNAQWDVIENPKNKLEFRLRNTNLDLCLGEEVVNVKAGKAGKPGPARVRTTWALVDCEKAPWWEFLYMFQNFKVDEKLCKIAGDSDSCLRYKNANRKMPLGLANYDAMSADDVNFDVADRDDFSNQDEDYYQDLYDQYAAMYAYYLDPEFASYDYEGYEDTFY